MPFNLSTGELVVLMLVAVLVFGGKLPEVARRIGRSITEFKRSMSEEVRRMDIEPEPEPPPEWEPPPDGEECDGFGGPRESREEPPSETA